MTPQIYYNDIEHLPCEVLRKNIKLGNLPEGYVDERDIRQVSARDVMGYGHVHLFAGIGGFPLGFKWAGVSKHIRILTGGFPCFTAGTMVLTETGFQPIETLSVGDKVLTHTGQWRLITSVMRRHAPSTRIIQGQGFPDIRTTDEHPFYVRHGGRYWENSIRQYRRSFSNPEWISAERLSNTTFVGQVLPIEPFNDDHNTDFWWIVGRYLADGWRVVSNGKGRVVICTAKHEANDVEERIKRVFNCTKSDERTTVKFHITRIGFHQFLEQFGNGADGKTIPGWVFGLESEKAAALLDGYITGDGSPYRGKNGESAGRKATTVSRSLALGIALLAQRAHGVVASIHEAQVPTTTTIEGRSVNQLKQYQVVIPDRNRSAFVDGNCGWKLVRSNILSTGAEVYNISVADDESYVADGVIVHNCQDISNAGKRAGITGSRSGLWAEQYRLIQESLDCGMGFDYIVVENVAALINRGLSTVLGDLAQAGYDAEWRVLRASDFGAPHRRERVFIVAYSYSNRQWIRQDQQERGTQCPGTTNTCNDGTQELMDYTSIQGLEECGCSRIATSSTQGSFSSSQFNSQRQSERGICRVFNGLPYRVDRSLWPVGPGQEQYDWEPARIVAERQPQRVARLKALGNGIVPQIAQYIGYLIINHYEQTQCRERAIASLGYKNTDHVWTEAHGSEAL